MIEIEQHVLAPPAAVWTVLADGWRYPAWVVGASRMRAVDDGWPGVGTQLHHSAGSWPLLLSDVTTVEVCDPRRRLVLLAKGRPLGAARVEILIEADDRDGGCVVRLREDAAHGPARLVPRPVRQVLLGLRNRETLRRLAMQAERRSSPEEPTRPRVGGRLRGTGGAAGGPAGG